jgi:hypothetical protein
VKKVVLTWTVLKIWSIGSISDSTGLDGFGAKACGGSQGNFDIDDQLKRLSDLGDQLEAFRSAVDFEPFRPELNAVLSYTQRTEGRRVPGQRVAVCEGDVEVVILIHGRLTIFPMSAPNFLFRSLAGLAFQFAGIRP